MPPCFERRRLAENDGSVQATVEATIRPRSSARTRRPEENQFFEVTYAGGDKEILYFTPAAHIGTVFTRAREKAGEVTRCRYYEKVPNAEVEGLVLEDPGHPAQRPARCQHEAGRPAQTGCASYFLNINGLELLNKYVGETAETAARVLRTRSSACRFYDKARRTSRLTMLSADNKGASYGTHENYLMHAGRSLADQ